jgi:hypothetical protein
VRNVIIAIFAVCACLHIDVRAQGHGAGDPFVSLRGGANLVGNTYRVRERKPEPGAGGSVGTFLSPIWALEFETWVRASNPECCFPRRREALYSLSAIRLLAQGRLKPYMLGGLTWLQGNDGEFQVQVGVGAQLVVHRRLDIALDLRGNGGGSTMIVRPTAALIYYFR